MLLMQDRNGCGTQEIIEGDFSVTLSEDAVNNCKTKQKILKVENEDNTYYSIFKVDKTQWNYPLNKAKKEIFTWQIEDTVNDIPINEANTEKDESEEMNNEEPEQNTQNLFSFQMKSDYLRGKGDLINKDFISKVLISSEDEEEEYEETRGYGTTGEFEYSPENSFSHFNYPVFIVAETDNNCRALSPVYDFSEVVSNFLSIDKS